MATQFDPIAKDESLNTTEATPRNIADVIAEGLKGIEDALPTYTEGDGIDISAQKEISVDTTFTEASTRANIASGDSFSTILGKIKKWFTDLPNMFVSKTGGTFSGNVTVDSHNGTTSAEGYSALVAGNNIPQGTAGNARGQLLLYGNESHYALFMPGSLTADRAFDFPDKSGTIALTDDIHEIKASANATVDDLYYYVTPGVYCVYLTTSVSPLMAGDLYVLEVFTVKYNNTTTGHVQRLNRVYPVTGAKIFQRVYYGVGGWSAWREL